MEEKIRLNKFLSEVGYCSRREADRLIEKQAISVNGELATLGTKVDKQDEISVFGSVINTSETKPIYIAFNKPRGIECTTNLAIKDNVIQYINYPERIFPIGRLDKDSEGLLLLTNDGDIVNQILRARNNHEKEYIVTVDKPITKDFVTNMRQGVPILETITRPCEVYKTGIKTFSIILTQGMNRQIRRMCEQLGFRVMHLKRIRIITIPLNVEVGTYRLLTSDEISELQKAIEPSSKTEEASLPKNKNTHFNNRNYSTRNR